MTPREVEVCELMRTGLKNNEIAKRMEIAESTLEAHVHNMKCKAGYSARAIWAASLLASSGLNAGKEGYHDGPPPTD